MTAKVTIESRLRELLHKLEVLSAVLPSQEDLRAVVRAEMALIMADIERTEDWDLVGNFHRAIEQDAKLRVVPLAH